MSKKLDEIMRISDKGYIDDPEDVKAITDNLVYSTLEEISTAGRGDAAYIGHDMLIDLYLPYKNSQKLRFGELLNLTRIICIEDRSPVMASRIIGILRTSGKSVGKVKLFMSMTVSALTDYIDNKTGTSRGSWIFKRMSDMAMDFFDFELNDKVTIKALFERFNGVNLWNGRTPVNEFADRVFAAYSIIKMLMIDCFRFAYKDVFCLSELEDRLLADEDDWEHEDNSEYYDVDYDSDPYDNVSISYDKFCNIWGAYPASPFEPDFDVDLDEFYYNDTDCGVSDDSGENRKPDDSSNSSNSSGSIDSIGSKPSEKYIESTDPLEWDKIVKMIREKSRKAS